MDLFSSADVKTTESPHPDLDNWVDYFSQTSLDVIRKAMSDVEEMRKGGVVVYPEQQDILRIFREIHPDKLRIVILGQDPYHDGNATGYAFAVKKHMTPSLRKIWQTIQATCPLTGEVNANPNLQYLVDQGVMLLNTVLTVEAGKPHSHKHLGWETAIANFLKTLSFKRKGIIFMLWGKYAQTLGRVIEPEGNYILTASHPASASYNNTQWKHENFIEADLKCMRMGLPTIKWR